MKKRLTCIQKFKEKGIMLDLALNVYIFYQFYLYFFSNLNLTLNLINESILTINLSKRVDYYFLKQKYQLKHCIFKHIFLKFLRAFYDIFLDFS